MTERLKLEEERIKKEREKLMLAQMVVISKYIIYQKIGISEETKTIGEYKTIQ